MTSPLHFFFFFFFNDTATTEIYTLSLHDALPISPPGRRFSGTPRRPQGTAPRPSASVPREDRKSTRLNSSHGYISYAVFCLKKKKKKPTDQQFDSIKNRTMSCRLPQSTALAYREL